MKINNMEVKGKEFAFDGCHKIYIIEDEEDKKNAESIGYNFYDIEDIEKYYNNSCELRFIRNWKLTKIYVKQFEKAVFEM